MVTFLRVARPILMLLAGVTAAEPALFKVTSGFDYVKKPGRREWLRVRLETDQQGRRLAVKYPAEGSGILSSMVFAGGLLELPEACERVAAGESGGLSAIQRGDGMKILYFAWLRESIGVAEEAVSPPPEIADVAGLIDWLRQRGTPYDETLANPAMVRVAVNQEHVQPDHPVAPGDEVAFFPPVTGGLGGDGDPGAASGFRQRRRDRPLVGRQPCGWRRLRLCRPGP